MVPRFLTNELTNEQMNKWTNEQMNKWTMNKWTMNKMNNEQNENGIFWDQKWTNLGLNDGYTLARIGEHVTKLVSLHCIYAKNISSMFHQNLMIQNWDICWFSFFSQGGGSSLTEPLKKLSCDFCTFLKETEATWVVK